MTLNELAAAVGTAVTPIVVALAPWLHTRLRQLEQVRRPNGERVGTLEDGVKELAGRVEELSRFVHARPEPDTKSIRVVTCPGCGATVPVRRTQ